MNREMWRLWICVRESTEERENLREIREILKRKRECDFL